MILHSPFGIGSRLLPALKIGDGEVSLEFNDYTRDDRARYRWHINIPAGEFSEADLCSGVGGSASLQDMFCSLLTFLSAAAESHRYRIWKGADEIDPDSNESLFPAEVVEWAAHHSDEISMIQLDIEESGAVLIEE